MASSRGKGLELSEEKLAGLENVLAPFRPKDSSEEPELIVVVSNYPPLPETFIDFISTLEMGRHAMQFVVKTQLASINSLKNEIISPNVNQPSRFPYENINLCVTALCSVVKEKIMELLKTFGTLSVGFVGPSGIGKSFSLLYNYLRLRRSDLLVVLYVNNAEAFVSSSLYLIKELLFSFGPLLHESIESGTTLETSPLNVIDFNNCSMFIETFDVHSMLNREEIVKFLWAYYLYAFKSSSEIEMKILSKLLQVLRKFCDSIKRTFIIFFDQMNVLCKEDIYIYNRKELIHMLKEPGLNFHKVFWMASENNAFLMKEEKNIYRHNYFYSEAELTSALYVYTLSIVDGDEKLKWQRNLSELAKELHKYTNNHAIEVELLLNTSGSTLGEKWDNYYLNRVKDLVNASKKFQRLKISKKKKKIFFSLLPLVDLTGAIDDYLETGNCVHAFKVVDGKRVFHPGTIDHNLFYYDKDLRQFKSMNPAARMAIRKIMYGQSSTQVYSACKKMFAHDFSNPSLNGILFEKIFLLRLLNRDFTHFLQ